MKKIICLFLALSWFIINGSCRSDDNAAPTLQSLDSPNGIIVLDYGNEGNGRDIYITFEMPGSEDEVMNYNLILSKTGTVLSYSEATSLPEDRMYSIEKTGSVINHQVQADFKDSDGDVIQNDQSYSAYILTTSNTEDKLGSLSAGRIIQLKDIPYYEVKTLGNTSYPYMEALSYQDGYIMAPGEGNIYKVDVATGQYEIFDTGLPGPLGGGFDPHDGSYYGAMYSGGYVVKYQPDGTNAVFATEMIGPIGIAVDNDKNVYISNFDANFISKVTPDGTKTVFSNNSSGLINGPDGLVMAKGSLYSINFWDSRILKISSSGQPSLLATLPGTGNGYMAYADNFFFATSYTERKIYRIDMSGNYELIAGTGHSSTKDGPAELASFKNPNGIAIAGDTLFVGDEAKIRMVIKHE